MFSACYDCLDLFNRYERLPFQPEFHFREHVEIAGGQVRWVGRVGNSGHDIFCQEFPHNERGLCRRIVMVQQSLRPSTSQAICTSHFPSVVSKPCSKNSHWVWPGGTNSLCTIPWKSKNDQYWLDVAAKLVRFFWLRRGRHLPLQRLLLCFWVIIVQPWFITSYDPGQEVRIMSTCFFGLGAHLSLMVSLVTIQETRNKLCCNSSYVQFIH